jgi:hypothetical protein
MESNIKIGNFFYKYEIPTESYKLKLTNSVECQFFIDFLISNETFICLYI